MAISLKHTFVSLKADGTDSTLVQPSNWNDEHQIQMDGGKVLGRVTGVAGAAQELPIAVDPTLQSMIPPSGTTAERPTTPAAGMFRFNSTLGTFEGYTGASWGPIGGGGGATGGGSDQVFYQNDPTITTNYTLPTNKNSMSAGPITINSGVTVTVPSGAVWTVV